MAVPCVVYITAATLTSELNALWSKNMEGSRCTWKFYDNAMLRKSAGELGIAEAFETLQPWAYKADLWRYAQMNEVGGVFFDAELRLLKKPEEIFDLNETEKVQVPLDRDPKCYYNAIMAAPRRTAGGRKALLRTLRNIKRRSYGHEDSKTEPWLGHGPCTLARALGNDVRIIGKYPSPYAQDLSGDRIAVNGPIAKRGEHYGNLWGTKAVYRDAP